MGDVVIVRMHGKNAASGKMPSAAAGDGIIRYRVAEGTAVFRRLNVPAVDFDAARSPVIKFTARNTDTGASFVYGYTVQAVVSEGAILHKAVLGTEKIHNPLCTGYPLAVRCEPFLAGGTPSMLT